MEGLSNRDGSAPLLHLQQALTDETKRAGAHAGGGSLAGVVWTPSMRRMYTLLDRYGLWLALHLPCFTNLMSTIDHSLWLPCDISVER